MTTRLVDQLLSTRLLAKQFAIKIRESGARVVLVTSVEAGAGKSTFVSLLDRESKLLRFEGFASLVSADLYTTSPDQYDEELLVIDGPAFLEENGLYVLPEQWLVSVDAAIVMVTIRQTRNSELKKTIQWLSNYGVGQVYLVCNMKEAK